MALTLNNNLATIKPGDYVWCKYVAPTSGSVGTFSDFATKLDTDVSSNLIPVTSSATPNGYFKFICVGYDIKDRMKFIADRNIQNSISWDTLNTAGICSEKIINLNNNFTSTIRLLTSGVSLTDINDEWDQIIVNSTLNNTIVAGDNNVWNWNGCQYGTWTSTTYYNNSSRGLRGSTTSGITTLNGYNYDISSSINSYEGFRPVLLIQLSSIPIFSGNLLSSSIHTQDVLLTGTISNMDNSNYKIQYKILLNDIQIYPTSGYTEFANYPVSINYTIPNSTLTNINNKITIAMNNELNKTNTTDFYATVYNNVPNGILTLSNTTTHSDNIELTGNITDSDLDKISYRILINDIEMLPWGSFVNDPYIDYTILNKDLTIGDNIIKVEYKDNYKSIGLGSWSNIITKINNTSIINCHYVNGSLIGTVTDPDSDLTQYKILINNKQVYPELDYTEFNPVSNINYQINRNDILIGKSNIITIVAKDNFNGMTTQDISFIGDYVGLLFMDEQKQYYTTDIGELLKYLDFGTITLGQITDPVKILVQNKYGFSIKDINLYIQNALPNITVEFSKEENPFIATENLILEKEYAINEEDYFYVRLNTSISGDSINGTFKVFAKATPI